jgi:hypothetical protein
MLVDRRHFLGREAGRHDDFEHLDVVAVRKLAVADRRRLIDAGTGFEPDHTLSLVFELDPAVEHVHELERRAVEMGWPRGRRAGHRADDMRHGGASGGPFDAEVAILEKRTQAALEPRVTRMADRKTFRGHHSFSIKRRIGTAGAAIIAPPRHGARRSPGSSPFRWACVAARVLLRTRQVAPDSVVCNFCAHFWGVSAASVRQRPISIGRCESV